MTETIKVWRCIGCGRIDHPAPCVGICQDRLAELVTAEDHAEALYRIEVLEEIARSLATITPRPGEFESSYKALQERARKALGRLDPA